MFFFGQQKVRKPARQQQGFRPTLEALEDRSVPSVGVPGTLTPPPASETITGAEIKAQAAPGLASVVFVGNVPAGNTSVGVGMSGAGTFAVAGSPGALSGNVVQVPVHIPVNVGGASLASLLGGIKL
jgi:hypothetical protein